MTSRRDVARSSSASWGKAGVWIAFGVVTGVAAMVLTGMPEGSREDLFVFVAMTAVAVGVGSVITGYLDTYLQSNRNLIGMISGGVVGVAIVVSISVVSSTGGEILTEVLGYVPFGTMFIGGFLAAGGALTGLLGLRVGRRLGDAPNEGR